MKIATKLMVSVLFLGYCNTVLSSPFSYTGPPANDIDTASSTYVDMMVPDLGLISNITLTVFIDSPYADNVSISLVHYGVDVPVYMGIDDTFHSYIDATFDDNALSSYPISDSVVGTFKPSPGFLSAFNGLSINGLWQLKLQDTVAPDDGTLLLSWSIQGNLQSSVPEPSTILLLGAGLASLISRSQRSRYGICRNPKLKMKTGSENTFSPALSIRLQPA